jgi:branched-chain amino acid transport system substrate-binding protein
MKKATLTTLIISLLAVILLFSGCTKKSEDIEKVIKIGVILPLTGPAAFIGEQHKLGIDYAVHTLNSSQKNIKIETVFEDDGNIPKNALSAFNRLVDIHNVEVVITAMSASSMVLVPLAEQNKVILFANCGHPEIAKSSKWVFRNFPSSRHEIEFLMPTITDSLKVRSLGIYYMGDAFGEGGKDVILETLKKSGGFSPFSDPYSVSNYDYRDIVAKGSQYNPDGIFVFGYGEPTLQLIKQLRIHYQGIIFGSYNFSAPPLSTLSNLELNGAIFSAPKFTMDDESEKIRSFVNSFSEFTNKQPVWNAIIQYDAIHIIFNALGTKNKNLQESLNNISKFEGMAGSYIKNNYGEWIVPLTVKTYKNGIMVDFAL